MKKSSQPSTDDRRVDALMHQVESLTRVLEGSQLGFWDWDLTSNEVKRNAIWAQMLGYDFADIAFTTQQWTDFVHPDDRDRAWDSIRAVLDGRKSEHELTYRMKTKSGDYKWILDRARVVERDAEGRALRMSGTHTDIDQLKKTEAALHLSEKRFRGIFENAGVGIAQVSADGSFQRVNDTFCEITGYSRDELLNDKKNFQAITHPDDLGLDYAAIEQLLQGQANHAEFEKRYLRKDGVVVWVHLSVSLLKDIDDQPHYFISAVHDITKVKVLQEQLQHQARYDYLTGIPNRRYFMELAIQELARIQRYPQPLAFIMVDIDYFKRINDSHGHEAGDRVLREVAGAMRGQLREVDVLGRMGGEEFAIFLPQTNRQKAIEVADRLTKAIDGSSTVLEDGSVIHVTISIGVAVSTGYHDSLEALLGKADKGLYLAKQHGRNQFELFES